MCLSAGRGLPPGPHQQSQEIVPALITSFLEDGVGCGQRLVPCGTRSPLLAVLAWKATGPHALRADAATHGGLHRAGRAQCSPEQAALQSFPTRTHRGGRGMLHTPSTVPAGIIRQSCLGATSPIEHGRESRHPNPAGRPQPAQHGCGAATWSRAGGCRATAQPLLVASAQGQESGGGRTIPWGHQPQPLLQPRAGGTDWATITISLWQEAKGLSHHRELSPQPQERV